MKLNNPIPLIFAAVISILTIWAMAGLVSAAQAPSPAPIAIPCGSMTVPLSGDRLVQINGTGADLAGGGMFTVYVVPEGFDFVCFEARAEDTTPPRISYFDGSVTSAVLVIDELFVTSEADSIDFSVFRDEVIVNLEGGTDFDVQYYLSGALVPE